jgi:Tfp pilus assembly protein PilF
MDPATPEELRERAYLESRAEEAAARAADLRGRLEEKGVELWGDEDFPRVVEDLRRAGEELNNGDPRAAERLYGEALAVLEQVDSRSPAVLQVTLAAGRTALDDGDRVAAGAAFSLALRIAPDHQAAATGLRRAEVLEPVLELLDQGRRSERAGHLEQAADTYRQAVALDPFSPPAQEALARVQARLGNNAFAASMSAGLRALSSGDHAGAKEAFRRAAEIKPGAPQAADGLAQAEEAERLEAIARHRERAAAQEVEERWNEAAGEYAAVLALAPAARFAREGQERAEQRADLEQRLEYHRSHPERLVSDAVLEEAMGLLVEAEAAQPAGPKHRRQVNGLAELLEVAAKPVRVRLVSDDATEVTVYHVGRLGAFLSHELELRPGTYTVVGSRSGYRDVRKELVVTPDAQPQSLSIQCEEIL